MPDLAREIHHRLPREFYRGDATVVFTACVAAAQPLFTDRSVVETFAALLRSAAESHGCVVVIYCFMPDHLHLMLHGRHKSADTWQAMVEFKQRSGYWLKQHRPGVSWQKDFYDHVVRRDEDLGAQVRYIAANPVRKGLVSDWREYPHIGAIGIDLYAVISSTITL
jgi:putative transposase